MSSLVFISARNDDYEYARPIYHFLKSEGLSVFFSHESLPELASSDYRKQIDDALDRAEHMIVVTSSRANVDSSWVEAEWGLFINEKRSGRKRGNLITVIVGDIDPGQLPASLRYYEVIPYSEASFPRILRYVNPRPAEPAASDDPEPEKISDVVGPGTAGERLTGSTPPAEQAGQQSTAAELNTRPQIGAGAAAGDATHIEKGNKNISGKLRGPATDPFAVVSLVLGFVPILCGPSVLAIILGFVSLSRIKASPGLYKGRGLATAGIVLGFLFTVVQIIVFIISASRR